jgi:putative lipoprotein
MRLIISSILVLLLSACAVPEGAAPVVDAAHNSRNAIDWPGTYTGVVPCADCGGIRTTITLRDDGTYERQRLYLGKSSTPIRDSGRFSWNETGSIVMLAPADGTAQMYQVGEDQIFHLDRSGNRITGDLAAQYVLRQSEQPMPLQDSSSGIISGTVSYRERIALPPDAAVEIVLLDVSRMDVAATTIAEQTIDPAGQIPIHFELVYDTAAIDQGMQYAVRATIKRHGNYLFVTDRSHPVLTRGNPDRVELVLVRSGGAEAPMTHTGLHGTRWELRELANEPVNREGSQEMHFLQFDDDRKTAFGFAGCNKFTGEYMESGTALKFGNLARTMRACPSMALEDRFHRALQAVEHYEIRGTWLVLYGAEGQVATFEAWYE